MDMPERDWCRNAMDRGWWLHYISRKYGKSPEAVGSKWQWTAALFKCYIGEKIRFQYWGQSI